MAHSKPDRLGNRGDASRATTAAGFFVVTLCADPRVNAHYEHWRDGRDELRRAVDCALAEPHRDPESVAASLEASIDQHRRDELEATQRFVRDELRLPYSWVAPSLLDAFRIRVYNEQHPEDQKPFGIPVYVLPEHPKGKAPARHGTDLQEFVRWFYRRHVQQPDESIRTLAREYAVRAKRDNDCRSVVQNGIDQVRALFELVEDRYIVQRPGYVVTRDPAAELK